METASMGPGPTSDIRVRDHLKLTPLVLVYLSFFAAIGMAVKQLAYPIASFALAPFLLPVAPFVSGAYMLWLTTGRAVTGFRLAGTFMGAVQAFVSFLMVFGRHGAFSLPLYITTGLCVDIIFLALGRSSRTLPGICFATAAASVVGAVMVVGIELQMADSVLYATALIAASSGILGGIAAFRILKLYKRTLGARFQLVPGDDEAHQDNARTSL